MQLPFEKPILTSGFGNRTINGHIEFHPGIDIIPAGSGAWVGINHNTLVNQVNKRLATKIVSCLDGVVTHAGYLSGGGYTVIIESQIERDGQEYVVRLGYSHLQENLLVNEGDFVSEGQEIGLMGYSDVNFENTHLHLGLSVNPQKSAVNVYNDNQQNPIGFLFGYKWNAHEGSNEVII